MSKTARPIFIFVLVGLGSITLSFGKTDCDGQITATCYNEIVIKINQVQINVDNMMPPGFIYVQFPNQPEPTTLFTRFKWTEVTSEYAGYFFRAAGGWAAPFGTPQGDSCPRITKLNWGNAPEGSTWPFETNVADGTSPHMFVSTGNGGYVDGISVTAAGYGTEVRPYNYAIRIWKRVLY